MLTKSREEVFTSPLALYAAKCGSVKVITFLHEYVAGLTRSAIKSCASVHDFIERVHLSHVHQLPLEAMFCSAAENGHENAMLLIHTLGANNLEHAVAAAASHGKTKAVRLACELWIAEREGNLPIATDDSLSEALTVAAENGKTEIVRILLKKIIFECPDVLRVLWRAAVNGKSAVTKCVIEEIEMRYPMKLLSGISGLFISTACACKTRVLEVLLPKLQSHIKAETLRKAVVEVAWSPHPPAIKTVKWLISQGATVTPREFETLYNQSTSDASFCKLLEKAAQKWREMLDSRLPLGA